MGLDKISIGVRIRKIREERFRETRQVFAEKCGLSENHLGKLERGEILISVNALDKICSKAGENADYILYGKAEGNQDIRNTIDNFLCKSTEEELKVFMNFISLIKGLLNSDK